MAKMAMISDHMTGRRTLLLIALFLTGLYLVRLLFGSDLRAHQIHTSSAVAPAGAGISARTQLIYR